MDDKLLLIVEDSFHIQGRGVVLAPLFDSPAPHFRPQQARVRLVSPSGSETVICASIQWTHFTPGGFKVEVLLPAGTQVEAGSRVFAPPTMLKALGVS